MLISPAIRVARKKHLPLYCGEFGIYPAIPGKFRMRWYQDLCDIFRNNDIAYCHWNYKADFPVLTEMGTPNAGLVSILTGK
jgi:endoglucanase